VTKNEHWSFARDATDSAIDELVRNRITNNQNPALRETPDNAYQPLLQDCSSDRQDYFSKNAVIVGH
jgi:hypothetical protein